ncbi:MULTISPECIES: ComF family protein [unclassified Meiothermus]|uniref:ComF family protein n=1 Tax=unclassified Meiothermus TaxID=370471 RepID=UPI000D7C7B19|nr:MULTISPECIES: ComF family protein [unclassified Meiothermus]PZA08053.1 ComF family protein [Meiothermus sp. Pnk-1]RYM32700.1 ComF family protein [Meiothermus sp. PNK-Is4]
MAWLEALLGLRCPGCGGDPDASGLCRGCRSELEWQQAYGVLFLGSYRRWGRLSRSIKYGGRRDVVKLIAQEWAKGIAYQGWKLEGITAVPTLLHRRIQRGYNQAELLGRALAEAAGLPYRNVLSRLRYAPSQTRRVGAERAALPADTFVPRQSVSGAWLLVDDVITSGSTFRLARNSLLEAGAWQVYGACIAVKSAKVLQGLWTPGC